MTTAIRLLIVEDHVLLREGLVSLLKAEPDFDVVGEAGSVAEAIAMSRQLKPNLILMDYSLPDGTGLDATRAILAENPDTDIVFLTIHESDDDLFAAIRSGAKGYLLKNIPVSKMVTALKGIEHGEAPLSRGMVSRILAEFARKDQMIESNLSADWALTSRELEVLKEISTGASNQEIANRLSISVYTVKNHIHNTLEKLDLKNRRQLADFASQHGLTKPPRN
jgi:DNA-binding NarL/FixJ family response regulator